MQLLHLEVTHWDWASPVRIHWSLFPRLDQASSITAILRTNMAKSQTLTTQISSINSNSSGRRNPQWMPQILRILTQTPPMAELQPQTAKIRLLTTYNNSSSPHQVQSPEPQCNCTLSSSEPNRSAAEARRGWNCTSSANTILSNTESSSSASISRRPMQCSLKVGLQLPIVRNQPHRLSLDLAANLIASSKWISDQEVLVSTLPLQRRVRAIMVHQATTGSVVVSQEPLSAHQVSLSGQLNIQPTTQTGLARFTLRSRPRHKHHKLWRHRSTASRDRDIIRQDRWHLEGQCTTQHKF